MTTYTWNPSAPAVPVDWNTPSDWLPASVPNSPDADQWLGRAARVEALYRGR
jgi:hypothetical protein